MGPALLNKYGERVVMEVIQGKFWLQHVDFVTHEAGKTLDLVLGREGLILGTPDEGRLGFDDHNMIEVELIGPGRGEDNKELVPDWAKADMAGMREAIGAVDWEDKLNGKTGLEKWELVKQVIREETDKCVPKRMRRVGNKPLWMNQNILRLIRKKKRLWRAYTRPGGPIQGRGARDHDSFKA